MADAILRKVSKLRIRPGDVLLVHDEEIFNRIKAAENAGMSVFPLPIMVLHVPRDAWTKVSFEEQAEIFIKAADAIKAKLAQETEAQRHTQIITPRDPDEPMVKLVEG